MSFPFADMRFRNVFGAQDPNQAQAQLPSGNIGMNQDLQQVQPSSTPTDAITDAMSGAAPPAQTVSPLSNVMSQKLQEALDMMPQRQDYKPTKFRKILSAMAGVGAKDPEEQQRVMDEIQNKPYYQDMNDWLTHVKTLMQGASEEDKQNVNRRIAYLTGRGLDIKEYQGQQKLDIDAQRADTASGRAIRYGKHLDWLEQHPDWKPIDIRGGNKIYYNPKDPTQTYDSGYPSGKDTDDQLQKAIRERAESVASINAAGKVTAKTTPAAKPVGSETPQQTQVRLRTRATQAYNEHPEWRPLIDLAPGGDKTRFEIKGPTAWQTFTDKKTDWQDMQHKIYQYIYGNENTTDTGNVKSIVPVTPEKK